MNAFTVVGCGMMGAHIARMLAAEPRTRRLHLVDPSTSATAALAAELSPTVHVRRFETWSPDVTEGVVVAAAPWPVTERVLSDVVTRGGSAVTITRPPAEHLDSTLVWLAGGPGCVVLPAGLEPGLTEIVLAQVLGHVESLDSADVYCGGVVHPAPKAFPYTILFGGDLLPLSQRASYTFVRGERHTVPRFSDEQIVQVPGMPALEAFHDGMVPWLGRSLSLGDATVTQRTLRWPGYAQTVRTLARVGVLAEHPVDVDGTSVVPKRVLERCLAGHVTRRPGDKESTHLLVRATGKVDGRFAAVEAHLHCSSERARTGTGMSTLTAAPAAQAAIELAALAAAGERPQGWLWPETFFTGARFDRLIARLTGYGATWSGVRSTTGRREGQAP